MLLRSIPSFALLAIACFTSGVAHAHVATSLNYTLDTTVVDGAGGPTSSVNYLAISATAQPAVTGGGATLSYTAEYGFIPCTRNPEGGEGEGEGEGEGGACLQGPFHTADQDENNLIGLNELLRIIQFYNSGGFGCQLGTEDGYAPNDPDQGCCPHDSDYHPDYTASWTINLTELLRLIQFFNSGGYYHCPANSTEDGYCPGVP
jgi:hypothetical protein